MKALNSFSYLFFLCFAFIFFFYDGNYFIEVNKIKSNKVLTLFNSMNSFLIWTFVIKKVKRKHSAAQMTSSNH